MTERYHKVEQACGGEEYAVEGGCYEGHIIVGDELVDADDGGLKPDNDKDAHKPAHAADDAPCDAVGAGRALRHPGDMQQDAAAQQQG